MVNVAAEGVPKLGVTRTGLVENTKLPEPVSSETANASLALVGSAKNVATLAPKPLTPVLIGRPVALVNVAADGVPKLGVTRTGLFENTKLPVPVSSEIKVANCKDVVEANCDRLLAVSASPVTAPTLLFTAVTLASVYVVDILEPFHTPVVIVPTDVKLELTTLGPRPVALNT